MRGGEAAAGPRINGRAAAGPKQRAGPGSAEAQPQPSILHTLEPPRVPCVWT